MSEILDQPGLPLDASTRTRVLHVISAHGPICAADIAAELDLTVAGVRRHLDALVEQSAITEHDTRTGRRGPGRPARSYVIAASGHSALSSAYDSLAAQALRFLQQEVGSQAVERFAKARAEGLTQRYAAHVTAQDSHEERARALVDSLSEDGFAATARPLGHAAGIQICQGHCPVQHVAREFPELCEAETAAFSNLLGVPVQRLATLAGGDHVCTTFIPTPRSAADRTTDRLPNERDDR